MSEEQYVTVTEAARLLGVHREKVRRLIARGTLISRPGVLDARQTLIAKTELEALLRREGGRPTRPRRLPRTIAIYDGPVDVPSSEIDRYMREHWRPE